MKVVNKFCLESNLPNSIKMEIVSKISKILVDAKITFINRILNIFIVIICLLLIGHYLGQ